MARVWREDWDGSFWRAISQEAERCKVDVRKADVTHKLRGVSLPCPQLGVPLGARVFEILTVIARHIAGPACRFSFTPTRRASNTW